jgi:DNA-binding FadR family transcriptional regulator
MLCLNDPERAAITGRSASDNQRAQSVANTILLDFIVRGGSPGEIFATIPYIRKRYELGRWACREALGILEMRGLAKLRRGAGGGLVMMLPKADSIVKLMLLHLYLTGAQTTQIFEARRAIYFSIVRSLFHKEHRPLDSRERYEGSTDLALTDGHCIIRHLAARTGNDGYRLLLDLLDAIPTCYAQTLPIRPSAATKQSLLDAVAQKDWPRTCQALDQFLAETRRFSSGKDVGLPTIFKGNPSRSTKYAEELALILIDEMAQRRGDDKTISLGSEKDIGLRHRFHREIVRQAVRILQDLGAVVPRRGQNGGIQYRKPDMASVIELISLQILQAGVSPEECEKLLILLKAETVSLAALHIRAGQTGDTLLSSITTLLQMKPNAPHELILMENMLADLAENPILSACDRAFVLSGPSLGGGYVDADGPLTPTRIAHTSRIVEAILRGSPDDAANALAEKYQDLQQMRPS